MKRMKSIFCVFLFLLFVFSTYLIFGTSAKAKSDGINILLWTGEQENFFRNELETFTKETGIHGSIEAPPWGDVRTKLLMTFMAKNPEFDVFYGYPPWVAEFADAGFLETFDDKVKDMKDLYLKGAVENFTINGSVYLWPRFLFTTVGYYRKDLFEEAGIEPPTNWDEMISASKTIQDMTKGKVYGFARQFGEPFEDFVVFLQGAGGVFYDKDGMPKVDTPEAEKALEFMVELANNYAPRASIGWDRSTYSRRSFAQGELAMTFDLPEGWVYFNKSAESKVAGKVGLMLIPGSAVRSSSYSLVEGYAMPKDSQNKDAAWEYIKWSTTSPERQMKMFDELGYLPVLAEVYKNPKIQEDPLMMMVQKQMEYPCANFRTHPQIQEIMDILCDEIKAALLKTKTPARALSDAQSKIEKALVK